MIAVITGSSRGIGLELTKKLLSLSYMVIAAARSDSPELALLRNTYPDRLHFFPCDISQAEQRNALLAYAKTCGPITLLINNAGVAPKTRKNILEITEAEYDYVVDINLKGTFFMCQLFGDYFKGEQSGRIVNISSVSSYTASPNRGEYCISKAGISMVTKLFASELSRHGVGVFEIMPGIIETDMIASVAERYRTLIADGLTPIDRLGRGEDIAKCVVAIAQGLLDFCAGQVLCPDGGFSIRRL